MTPTAPAWLDPRKPGLRSAKQNIADGSVLLQVTEAIPSHSSLQVVYLVYAGELAAPATPTFISPDVPVLIPAAFAGGDWHFKVTATNGAGLLDSPGLSEVVAGLYAFPDAVALAADFGLGDPTFSLSDDSGYPADGYIVIGGEIVQYASLSGDSGTVVARGLFGSPAVPHSATDEVTLGLA